MHIYCHENICLYILWFASSIISLLCISISQTDNIFNSYLHLGCVESCVIVILLVNLLFSVQQKYSSAIASRSERKPIFVSYHFIVFVF